MRHCAPCEKKARRITSEEIKKRLLALPGWRSVDDHHLTKAWSFLDFKSALAFVNKIAAVAEEENHHPDIFFTWGFVEVKLFTHSINGITENDFIMAELIEGIGRA